MPANKYGTLKEISLLFYTTLDNEVDKTHKGVMRCANLNAKLSIYVKT